MKTNLDQYFKVDETHSEEGVDFVINEKTSFRLRHYRASNPRVKAAMAAYYKPYARQIEIGAIPESKALEIQIKLFIDVSLVSWTGVEMDGKEVPFSKENAVTLFTALPKLFDNLFEHAKDHKNYVEDVGNS